MPTTALAQPAVRRRRLVPAIDAGAGAWLLGFALVSYLALAGGGYDAIVRNEVGIAVWWLVLIGTAAGVLPARFGRTGWALVALLVAFAAWTGLSTAWSDSTERSVAELGKVATYAGFLVLAMAVQVRRTARLAAGAVACAIGLVAILAVLSRLEPSWIGTNDQAHFLGTSVRKLSWPLNYWNALAALMAMGAPLLLAFAAGARTLPRQALSAAVLPVVTLCLFFTVSRGGTLAFAAGLIVFLALAADRVAVLGSIAVAAAGSAILVGAAAQRDALESGVRSAAALHQGDDMLALTAIVCAGAALLQVAAGLAARHATRPRWMTPRPRSALALSLAGALAAVAVAVAAGAPGWASDRWDEFKSPGASTPTSQEDIFARLRSTTGNSRFQYWESALEAAQTRPLGGRGAGTFEFWWAEHGTRNGGFVRHAHSLYFQTLADLGWLGLALLVAFLLVALAAGTVRALRAPPATRVALSAAVAAIVAFAVSAAFEWTWEIAVLPAALLALVAVAAIGRGPDESLGPLPSQARAAQAPAREPRPVARIALVVLALAALPAIAIPLAGTSAVRESQAEARANHVAAALGAARSAERVQPYAATPFVQRALLLEGQGRLDEAMRSITKATHAEPKNWRVWLIRSRIQAERGHAGSAVAAYRRARALNPRSPVFAR